MKTTPLLFCLVVSSLALAQNPSTPAAAQGAGAAQTARLQFPNSDVKDVLDFYAHLTRKRIVIDNQVQGTVYIVVAAIYFAMCFPLTQWSRRLERTLRVAR